jgi:hypothetical protein
LANRLTAGREVLVLIVWVRILLRQLVVTRLRVPVQWVHILRESYELPTVLHRDREYPLTPGMEG